MPDPGKTHPEKGRPIPGGEPADQQQRQEEQQQRGYREGTDLNKGKTIPSRTDKARTDKEED